MRWYTQQNFSPDTTFDQWVEAVKTEFGAGRMSLAGCIRQRVGVNEPISEFLRRMTWLGDAIGQSRKDQMSVIKNLLISSNNLITTQVLVSKEVTRDLLKTELVTLKRAKTPLSKIWKIQP
ncbi:hypothetical protein PAPHI01_2623 [Pancytospora philotis]|nr:hypothetical protein PAPHI01_2623 [Pancytospora philotis]